MLTDGLLAYWKLDETSGNAADSHSTNTGTSSNITYTATGKIGRCYTFNGTTSQVSFGNVLKPTGALSISAWIKTTSATEQHVLDCLAYATGYEGYGTIIYNDGSSGLMLGNNTAGLLDVSYNPVATNLVDGAWHHVVWTWNGTTAYMYHDVTNKSAGDAWSNTIVYNASNALYLGVKGDGSSNRFTGDIDEVAIYNRAISDAEVAALNNNGAGLGYPFYVYNGVLYIRKSGVWVPRPLELEQTSVFNRRPVRAYHSGAWNLIQSF